MAAVVYAGSPVDAYLEEQGMGEISMAYNNQEERRDEPMREPEAETSQAAPAATTTTTTTRPPAHDRLAALVVAHLNSPYAVAVATATATATDYAQNAELPATTKAQTATLSRRGQLILVSLFGTVIAYPGLTSASSSSTVTSTWAVVVRLTPPLIILSGVVALWATSHSTTTSSSIPRQVESQPIHLGTRIDLALQELTKHTIAFVQQWTEWETLSGRVVEVLDTLDNKRQRNQRNRRHASSSKTRRRDSHVDIPEADYRVYEILHDLCAEIEEACSELFIEKYATANDGDQEQQRSGIDMQELKLLLEMYVPHTIPAPIMAQPEMAASSPRMSQQELIKARRRSWAAFPTTSSLSYNSARQSDQAISSPITRARSSETHAVDSLPGTPIRIRYPTSPIHASTPRNSTTPQAYILQHTNECAGSNPGSASKVRGSRKRYSEQFIGHPSSPSSSSIGGFESYSPTNPSPLSLAMANASSSSFSPSASQAMQRAATTGSDRLLYDGNKPETTRSSLDSPRSLIASGRLAADNNYRRIQAHHPSSPAMSISPSWANSSPSISRIKQRPLSTPNGLGLDWRAYQDQPVHHIRTSENHYAQQHLSSYSAHKRHSSSFSATRFAEYNNHNNADLSGRKARPTSLHLQASPKLLSPSSRAANGGRFEVQHSDHHEDAEEEEEEEIHTDNYAKSKAVEAQRALCALDSKRREILCIILALRAVPGLELSSPDQQKDQDRNVEMLAETCHLLGASLSELSAILGKRSCTLRESCRDNFGTSFSQILLPTPSNNGISRESREKAHSTTFPGQFPSSPLIEVESASPSPTGSTHHNRCRSSTKRRHSRSVRRGRSQSPSSTSSDDQQQQPDSFAPKQVVPLHVREALAEYKASSERIENLLADLAIDMHLNKSELEELTEEYRGDTAAEEYLAELLQRQEELRTNTQSLLSQVDVGRLALRRIRDTSRTSASSSCRNMIEQEERSGADQEEDKDVSADMTFSDDFLNKRGSLSSTLSSSNNDELINTPPLKPSHGNPEISLSSSTSSSAGIHDARNTISQLLLDPSNTNAKNMPAFLNFQEKLYETYTAPAVTAVEQTVRSKNKLSREERIALTKAKREALHDGDAAGAEEGPARPLAKLELVQELKDVVKILRERRAPVMTPEQAEEA